MALVRLFLGCMHRLTGLLIATFHLGDGWGCSSIVRNFDPYFCSWILTSPSFLLIQNSLFSFLPPYTTIRRYHRNLLSTTSVQLGTVYCAILSFASTKSDPEIQEVVSGLLAIRAKLNRSVTLRTNITYEVRFTNEYFSVFFWSLNKLF